MTINYSDEVLTEMIRLVEEEKTLEKTAHQDLQIDMSQFSLIPLDQEEVKLNSFPIMDSLISSAAMSEKEIKTLLEEKKTPTNHPDIVEEAHPDTAFIADGPMGSGVVENQNEQHQKILNVVYKMPTGFHFNTMAALTKELISLAEKLEEEGNLEAVKEVDDALAVLCKKKSLAEVPEPVNMNKRNIPPVPKEVPEPVNMNKRNIPPVPKVEVPEPVNMNKRNIPPVPKVEVPEPVNMNKRNVPPIPKEPPAFSSEMKRQMELDAKKDEAERKAKEKKENADKKLKEETEKKKKEDAKKKKKPLSELKRKKPLVPGPKKKTQFGKQPNKKITKKPRLITRGKNSLKAAVSVAMKHKGKVGLAAGLATLGMAIYHHFSQSKTEWEKNIEIAQDETKKANNQNALQVVNKVKSQYSSVKALLSSQQSSREMSVRDYMLIDLLIAQVDQLDKFSTISNKMNEAVANLDALAANIQRQGKSYLERGIRNKEETKSKRSEGIKGMKQWLFEYGNKNMVLNDQVDDLLKMHIRAFISNMKKDFGPKFNPKELTENNLIRHGSYEMLDRLYQIWRFPKAAITE